MFFVWFLFWNFLTFFFTFYFRFCCDNSQHLYCCVSTGISSMCCYLASTSDQWCFAIVVANWRLHFGGCLRASKTSGIHWCLRRFNQSKCYDLFIFWKKWFCMNSFSLIFKLFFYFFLLFDFYFFDFFQKKLLHLK